MVVIRKTPYSQKNQEFTDKGHLCAQNHIYPLIFPNSELQFIPLPDEQARTLDADMGMDRRALVKIASFRDSYQVMVQERFRGINWASKRDITITEYNHNSHMPGEFYKIKAEMFLYAYFDPISNRFIEAIAVSMIALKIALTQGTIKYTIPKPNSRSNQTFLCFKFDDLIAQHIAVFHHKWERQVTTNVSQDENIERARQRTYYRPEIIVPSQVKQQKLL